jgi:4-alpha-glucanotransferase
MIISGIMPLYPCYDCTDVWAHKERYLLNSDGTQIMDACVPPDLYEPEKGQLWGNPLWRFGIFARKDSKEDVYDSFVNTVGRLLRYFDRIIIDHFRGYTAFGGVRHGEPDARNGKWYKGPGNEIFHYIERKLGLERLPLDVEDLGLITDTVHRNRIEMGYPGMKVFQFAELNKEDNIHHPRHKDPNSIKFIGTHDSATIMEFFFEPSDIPNSPSTKSYLDYVRSNSNEEGDNWKAIDVGFSTESDCALATISDVRGYGRKKGRFNWPGRTRWWNVYLDEREMQKFRDNDVPRLRQINKRHNRD